MENVVIVVPMYRMEMDAFERISWQQLQRVLGGYPICIIGPGSLADGLRERYHVRVEEFDDTGFQSVKSYSRMMLTKTLYERFSSFEYMLVYQLDTFVFSNRLQAFCRLGFDYIGAPWPLWMTVGRKFPIPHIGNGGLSLRKIASACRMLERKDEILRQLSKEEREFCLDAEDVFWAYCGSCSDLNFHLADVAAAQRFSIEHWSHWRWLSSDQLPFGVHDGSHRNIEWWRPFVEACGYSLPRVSSPKMCDGPEERKQRLMDYLLKRYLRQPPDRIRSQRGVKALRAFRQHYILWGIGKNGAVCQQIFSYDAGLLSAICDGGKAGQELVVGGRSYRVRSPEETERGCNDVFLISTTKYFNEICVRLFQRGIQQRTGFISFQTFLERFFAGYYADLWKGASTK